MKFTEQELLDLFDRSPECMVRMIINGELDTIKIIPISGTESEVEDIKKSLKKKAFFHVAEVSTKGTDSATEFSVKAGFQKIGLGQVIQIGNSPTWMTSAFLDKSGRLVQWEYDVYTNIIKFQSREIGVKYMNRPEGLHLNSIHPTPDLIEFYNNLTSK